MSKISFDGMGAVVATFAAGEGVKDGQLVKLTASGTVGPCGDGDAFCGVALKPRAGLAAVQVKGFAAVTGEDLTVGWAELVGDGKGGVRAAKKTAAAGGSGSNGSGENVQNVETQNAGGTQNETPEQGVQVLVVSVESDGTAVICL